MNSHTYEAQMGIMLSMLIVTIDILNQSNIAVLSTISHCRLEENDIWGRHLPDSDDVCMSTVPLFEFRSASPYAQWPSEQSVVNIARKEKGKGSHSISYSKRRIMNEWMIMKVMFELWKTKQILIKKYYLTPFHCSNAKILSQSFLWNEMKMILYHVIWNGVWEGDCLINGGPRHTFTKRFFKKEKRIV